MNKCYSELIQIPTFNERFDYLKLSGVVGKETFGYNRHLNQVLYTSSEWKSLRREIIIRDDGADLACGADFEIHGKIYLHHINPITLKDINDRNPAIFDPENLVITTLNTHNAIHYGDGSLLIQPLVLRTKNDTCPWR